jgi:DNA-binding protein HU-beta
MPTPKLNAEIITAAIEGFESQKRRIDTQIGELRAMLSGGRTEGTATAEAPKGKRKVSAAARRRMAEGQKKRWAAIKSESKTPGLAAGPEPAKPNRKISAAGRRAISEASKRRWALKRAEAAKAQLVGAKKAATQKTAAKKPAKKAPAKAAKKTAPKAPGQAATAEIGAQ